MSSSLRFALAASVLLAAGSPALSGEENRAPSSSEQPAQGIQDSSAGAANPGHLKAAEAANPAMTIQAKPRLEVQHGSGDFQSFHDSIVIDGSTPVRFRWSPTYPATKARWNVTATPLGPPTGTRRPPAGQTLTSAPEPGNWAFFEITMFNKRSGAEPAGATRYNVQITALNAQDQPVGQPSFPVVVDYKPPGQGPGQTIQLDSVQLLDWTPKSGLMSGPNDNKYYQYEANQKVDLSYRIELVTEAPARLSNSLVGQNGKALSGNFYTFVDVATLGVHTEPNFVTIRCDASSGNPYYEQQAHGLAWKLYRKGSDVVLSEGKKMFNTPLTWRCPGKDLLTLTGMNPATGTIRGIKNPADASQYGRSVSLHYQYTLGSRPKAVVKQVPLLAGYKPVPQEYWTSTTVSKGNGSASNVLSVYCQSDLQPDAEVKYLRYSLVEEGSGEKILQTITPVDWRFTCKAPQVIPGAMKGMPGIQPANSKTRNRPAESQMQKVAPAEPKAAPKTPLKRVVPAKTKAPVMKKTLKRVPAQN